MFGLFDFITAMRLFRADTRKLGLRIAVVGFSGGLYGQWYTGGEMGQVGAMLCLAVVGAALS